MNQTGLGWRIDWRPACLLATAAVPDDATIGPLDWICASEAGLAWRRPGDPTIGASILVVST